MNNQVPSIELQSIDMADRLLDHARSIISEFFVKKNYLNSVRTKIINKVFFILFSVH